MSDLVITKPTDGNSAVLVQASAGGTQFDSATITITSNSATTTVYQFSNVVIASYSISGTSPPIDTIDLNFASVSANYSSQDDPDAGSGGSWGGSLGQGGAANSVKIVYMSTREQPFKKRLH